MRLTLTILLGCLTATLLLYVAARVLVPAIIRRLDRARGNRRDSLHDFYELPRQIALDASGQIDPRAAWPGWDGWYLFFHCDDTRSPVRLIRMSLMTGLYGLEGIDDLGKLPPGLSPRDAAELLVLIAEQPMSDPAARRCRLVHRYLPRSMLTLDAERLDVSVTSDSYSASIRGQWPDVAFSINIREDGIRVDLECTRDRILWWADTPGVFTYFSSLGRIKGRLHLGSAFCVHDDPHGRCGQAQTLEGSGAFEHGFARQPIRFDRLWQPVRVIQKVVPRWRPLRYHYEVLVGEEVQGGLMSARGFGIPMRNLGGIYGPRGYDPLRRAQIRYDASAAPEVMVVRPGDRPVTFYRRWHVRAETQHGILEYVARRDWPAAPVSANLHYYPFEYEGHYCSQPIAGFGYGEYLRM